MLRIKKTDFLRKITEKPEVPKIPEFPKKMEVEVLNFPEQEKTEFPKKMEVEVLNFPEQEKTEFPKKMEVEVLNFPKEEKEIEKKILKTFESLVENGRMKVVVDRVGGGGGIFDTSKLSKEAKQDQMISALGALDSPTTTNLTLTLADTDYLLPTSEKTGRKLIIISNNSAYDVYIGQTGVIDCDSTPPIGILLPAGGSLSLECATGLYAQCDTAGQKLTITEF